MKVGSIVFQFGNIAQHVAAAAEEKFEDRLLVFNSAQLSRNWRSITFATKRSEKDEKLTLRSDFPRQNQKFK